ncbi:amidohydrolase family protein [Acuticoccus sp. MNP-M23]|uniref:amidohydrolase family protein n=1 Tax=Acuticoccus sp. MNP-M23 TaxID=3072793 RepID=UPI002815DB21|nr:amidohydrolase family protein [Acuticoccus sp. MNP-M23]WMS44524.1 amidohydrolase family protein [Acuticoccus sp. MNP-M23]
MTAKIVRGRTLFTGVTDRFNAEQIEDGAVVVEDGVITDLGTYADLSARHKGAAVIGSGGDVILPGFVNSHHHVGLTPVQLGSPDMPLELWFITRLVTRAVDLYLDTLYSAFEMIESGITTVQHIHGWLPGTLDEVRARSEDVLRAYDDIGMRVSYCYAVRDQNRLVYQADDELVASLPPELRDPMKRVFGAFKAGLDDQMALFRDLHAKHNAKPRARIQLAPANLHWCSDPALEALAEASESYDAPLHMHLLETAYQKEYAFRRGGGTAVDYIEKFGLLGPRLTLGHGVWLNESDMDKLAASGTCVCHNCSSNFRLRSGIAPLNALEARGINTGIGLDEAGLNDDRDMLNEMRLVARAHRVPGMVDADVPTFPQVLRMATEGGAKTTNFGDRIGRLEVGREADLVMVDWESVSYPYLDPLTPVLDAVMQRAKVAGVRRTMCAGEILYEDGRFTRVDRADAMKALHDDMSRALSDNEVERRNLSKALLPHVRKFYADYIDPARHEPFYRQSSRV